MRALDDHTENLMIQIIARDVGKSVEMAREIGHRMPDSFDVGVKFERDWTREAKRGAIPTVVTIRMDDASVRSMVTLPDVGPGGRHMSVLESSQLMEAAWRRIHPDSMTVVHVWLDKHPEAFTTTPKNAIRLLSAVQTDAELTAWVSAIEGRARKLRYERRR